jgi:AcrR family transcriptional regulator
VVTGAKPEVTRAKILEAIDRLFYRQGIRAVGVDTLVAELGISKKTLYRHFRSKSEMIEAYLRGRFRRFRRIRASHRPNRSFPISPG